MSKYLLIIGTALLICLSCTTVTDGDGNGNDYDQTTVLGTLNLFLEVWNDGDLDTYENLLDEDDFTFYFAEVEDSWGYEEEILTYTALFDYAGEDNVSVELDLSGVSEPEDGAETCTITDVPYDIWVEIDDFTYRAQELLDLRLSKFDGEWIITDWWDKFDSKLLAWLGSWGAIKAMF